MWALGMFVYILLCGFPPFLGPELRTEKASKTPFWPPILRSMKFDENVSLPSPHWDYISKEGRNFVTSLLRPNPKNRMTSKQLLEHPWFSCKLSNDPLKIEMRNFYYYYFF